MTPHRFLAVALLIFTSAAAFQPAASAANWPPIDPSELADTQGRVDPNADLEILFYECTEDATVYDRRKREYYLRMRVYNEVGVMRASIVELPYWQHSEVGSLSVRTTKPDGTSVEQTNVQTFDREVFKRGADRVRLKTFTPPAVEVGAIIEYRYTTFLDEGYYTGQFYFQQPVAVRLVRYRVRPFYVPGSRLRLQFFNLPEKEIKPDKDAYYLFEFENIKAETDEPFSPPSIHTQASVSIAYVDVSETDVSRYWSGKGKELQRRENKVLKATPRVKNLAASLAAPGDSAEVKLRKFYDHCRTGITNRSDPKVVYTTQERKKLPKNSSPDGTLEHGSGEPGDINEVFAALAATTGLETKLALVNDRGLKIVTPESADPDSVGHLIVAVKLNGNWVYFDPGQMFVPFGMLAWRYTDTLILMADKAGGGLKTLEGPKAEESVRTRTAALGMNQLGGLEGTVAITYTGLWEARVKELLYSRTEEERRDIVRSEVRDTFPGVVVTDIEIEGADDLLKPTRISYRISLNNYAERTGSRLFLQPAVFQKAQAPMFVNATRTYDIIFENRHTDVDEVQIVLPEGCTLEAATAPPGVKLEPLGRYKTSLALRKGDNTLVCKRTFSLDSVAALSRYYPPIRKLFEGVHQSDNHVLTLRRAEMAEAGN